jgi:hypothetical protein
MNQQVNNINNILIFIERTVNLIDYIVNCGISRFCPIGRRLLWVSLCDLYDPLTMPAPLLTAHQALDRAEDRSYRPEPFPSDRHRVEYLFARYEKLTAPRVAAARPGRKERKGPKTQGGTWNEVSGKLR